MLESYTTMCCCPCVAHWTYPYLVSLLHRTNYTYPIACVIIIMRYIVVCCCMLYCIIDIGISLDYWTLLVAVGAVESARLAARWTRWARNEYNHQFDHNIGIGNMAEVQIFLDASACLAHCMARGDDCVNTLKKKYIMMFKQTEELGTAIFRKFSVADQKFLVEAELNHGRLAMLAFIGMLAQEYLVGIPVSAFFIR